jgi:very-short-patch-repair endonuclease
MMQKDHRDPGSLIEFARQRRRSANEFAATVWQWLRNRRMLGLKFRREHPIPPYIADFCNLEFRLIIEIDGRWHEMERGLIHDAKRDQFLRGLGYRILRVPGYEVSRPEGAAMNRIEQWLQSAITGTKGQPSTANPTLSTAPGNLE